LTVRIVPHVLRHHTSIATRLTSGDEWPSRPSCRGGLVVNIHLFRFSQTNLFLRGALDSSGKTGGEFLGSGGNSRRASSLRGAKRRSNPSRRKRMNGLLRFARNDERPPTQLDLSLISCERLTPLLVGIIVLHRRLFTCEPKRRDTFTRQAQAVARRTPETCVRPARRTGRQ
jgi:hypothetical protein